jgi:ArsR family transcriptional regulator, arsenate/arsenite/antimonite-responsive transcriptional repressor
MSDTERAAGDEGEGADPMPVLIEFFKALVEPARLRIAGLIGAEPLTMIEVGQRSGLGARAARSHLGVLETCGLAVVEGEGASARYRLNEERMRHLAATLLDSPRIRAMAGATDERSRVLASFFRDGRLTKLPTGDKRRDIIIEEIAKKFESGRTYTEREVNEILKPIAEDYTTIRRWLVDLVFLNRHEGVYWVGEGKRSEQ